MAYATVADLVVYLDQLAPTVNSEDEETAEEATANLTAVLTRAEAFVNSYIGSSTSLAAAASGSQVVYGSGTRRLALPVLTAGSVATVSAPTGYAVPDYIEQDGFLVTTDAAGILYPDYPVYRSALYAGFSSGAGVWQAGIPYTVTADFGWNANDMAVLTQAALERAVQIWRYKDAGGSETIGAEGAITTVRTGWTPGIKEALDAIKQRVRGFTGGGW